jgi:putative Holliday junction resolvase
MLPLVPGKTGVRTGVRLGVDVGSVRVGVARSDPGGILASPLTVVRSGPSELDELAALVAGADAIEVIVGLPTSLSGREGIAAAGARSFAAELADRLAGLVAEHHVLEVIIGLPTTLAGREGQAAAAAREVAAALAARIAPVAVRLFDERFTTTTAHAVLRQGGKNSRARRSEVDQAAAAVLLQAALDAERATGQPPGEIVPEPGPRAGGAAG